MAESITTRELCPPPLAPSLHPFFHFPSHCRVPALCQQDLTSLCHGECKTVNLLCLLHNPRRAPGESAAAAASFLLSSSPSKKKKKKWPVSLSVPPAVRLVSTKSWEQLLFLSESRIIRGPHMQQESNSTLMETTFPSVCQALILKRRFSLPEKNNLWCIMDSYFEVSSLI